MTGSITWDNGTSENAPTFTGGGGGGTADTFTLNNAPATGNGIGALDIFIVSETLSATSGYPAISKAVGHITSGGNTATITWGTSKNATYNVFVSYFIQTTADYVGKFKNGLFSLTVPPRLTGIQWKQRQSFNCNRNSSDQSFPNAGTVATQQTPQSPIVENIQL
jgi:hypothetical protein